MRRPRLSENAVLNVQTALVLAAPLVALIAVPHAWLRPMSVAVAAAAALAVVTIRAWLRRLEDAARLLSSNPGREAEDLLAALLRPMERRVLRLGPSRSPQEAAAAIRARQRTLTSIGVAVALPGIAAFLVALYFFAD